MSKSAIASAIGLCYEELEEYRYFPGNTSRAVYAVGNDYYCAGKSHPKDLLGMKWEKAPDQWEAERKNTVVWIANTMDGGEEEQ